MTHRILELYSGIGGMHCAWNESGLQGVIVAAVDINTVANQVYQYNFPPTKVINRNIQSITPQEITNMKINTILMSPPCQPFTRNGKYLDENDSRTDSFIYLLSILDKLPCIEYVLLENVKGFESSIVRTKFVDKLRDCGFTYQEFLLCPTCVGVPNSRLRYYCIARRNAANWKFNRQEIIMQTLMKQYDSPYCLEDILESSVPDNFLLSEKQLKRANVLDICFRKSKKSCCFTKAYSHYIEGTGSVFTECSEEEVKRCFKVANLSEVGSKEFVKALKELKIRFFTPKEILSLMAFPKHYRFPESVTIKQCYRLLGNSVNIKVISELIKILFD